MEKHLIAELASKGKDHWNSWAEEELKKDPTNRTPINFTGMVLSYNFGGFVFPSVCNFAGARFTTGSKFKGATFHLLADFRQSTFETVADFEDTHFLSTANFTRTTFLSPVDFTTASFNGACIFDDATFQSRTLFSGVRFEKAPTFDEATLHQATIFSSGSALLRQFNDTQSPGAEYAYRTLKLKMSELQAHREELAFFALEMKSRARNDPTGYWQVLYRIYDFLSGYGLSWARPAIGLGVSFLAAVMGYSVCSQDGFAKSISSAAPWHVASSRTLPLPGLFPEADKAIGKLFTNEHNFLLDLAMAAHGLLSAVLIFLFVLALRNQFRIK